MQERPWHKSYGTIPREINADEYPSVVALLEPGLRQFANQVAVHSFGKTLTYHELDMQADALCAWLQHRCGIQKGDRIAVMVPNIAAFPITLLAIARAGAVQVNVNPLYTPRELEHQLHDAGCVAAVIFNGSSSILAKVADKSGLKTILTVNPGDGLGGAVVPEVATDAGLTSTIRFADALAQGQALTKIQVTIQGSDTLFLQYTGGTTGLSKGATLSHRNIVANVAQYKAMMQGAIRPGQEVVLTALPLYHIFALTLAIANWSSGADNWLIANPRDMDGLVDTLKQARPTILPGVNTLFAGLTLHPRIREVDWSNLIAAIGGGAAVIPATSHLWQSITGSIILEGYGLSETSPVLSLNPQHTKAFSGTTGLPVPSTDVKLLDANDDEAPQGEPGEICAKGPQVMSGYWNKPEANQTAFTSDGYFRTGDIGVITEEGLLKIVDRKKDMIIVSGFNVFPNDVEAIAAACPGVAECACVGVPDPKTGEAVKLFVVRTPGSTLTEAELLAHCRQQMTAYKIPRQLRFVEALPKSNVGKILRKDLRNVD